MIALDASFEREVATGRDTGKKAFINQHIINDFGAVDPSGKVGRRRTIKIQDGIYQGKLPGQFGESVVACAQHFIEISLEHYFGAFLLAFLDEFD